MHALILLAALAVSDLPPAKEAPDLPPAKEVKPRLKIETISETGPLILGTSPTTVTLPPAKETRPEPPYTMSYKSGYKLSKRSGMPLVVWVGLEPRQIGEGRLVNVGVKELEGYRAPCIVVAKWVDGRLMGKEVKSVGEAKDWLYPPMRRPQVRIAAPSSC